MVQEKINNIGEILRLITPLLIGIIGWFSISYLSSIDKKFTKIEDKFDNFITSYHLIDKRVDKLEYRVFGASDAIK